MKLSERTKSGSKYKLPPEDRLLFLCARTSVPESGQAEIISLVDSGVSWKKVLRKASWHRLSALLYIHLKRLEFKHGVPDEVMQELESTYYQNLTRNIYYQDQLGMILSKLAEQSISSIVLKGGAMAETIYGDVGLRPMYDLDIMVQEADADRAYETLMTMGFSPPPDQADVESYQRWKELHHHYPVLVSDDGLIPVEIHKGILPPGDSIQIDIKEFWNRAREEMISGSHVGVLSPEHLVFHLSIHCFRSLSRPTQSGGSWGQLCDISEAILHYGDTFDWGVLVRDAKRYGIDGLVYCMLDSISGLIHTEMPEAAMDDLKPEGFNVNLEEQFIESWILGSSRSPILELMDLKMQPTLSESVEESRKAWFRLRRIAKGLQFGMGSMIRPATMGRDIRIRRWVESLVR